MVLTWMMLITPEIWGSWFSNKELVIIKKRVGFYSTH